MARLNPKTTATDELPWLFDFDYVKQCKKNWKKLKEIKDNEWLCDPSVIESRDSNEDALYYPDYTPKLRDLRMMLIHKIRELIEKLCNDTQKEAITMLLAGMTISEIARKLGKSKDSIYNRIYGEKKYKPYIHHRGGVVKKIQKAAANDIGILMLLGKIKKCEAQLAAAREMHLADDVDLDLISEDSCTKPEKYRDEKGIWRKGDK